MKRELVDLVTEIRGVEESLFVLSFEFEDTEGQSTVGSRSIHMMLYAVMTQLDRIAEDIERIDIEHRKGETEA